MLVLLAKLGSAELLGSYSFAVAVATPVVAFASLQLRAVQVTDGEDQQSFRDYLAFRIWTVVAAMFILTAICLVMRYPARSILLIELVGLTLVIESISDLYYGIMQIHAYMSRIAKSMMARGLLSVSAISITLVTTKNLVLTIVVLALVRIAVALMYDMGWGTKSLPAGHSGRSDASAERRPLWRIRPQLRILTLALPLGLVSLLVSLNTSIPRYFIQWSLGPRELGIFSALCFFPSSSNMISTALGQAAFARLASAYGNRQLRTFRDLLGKLLLVAGALGVVGIAVGWLWGYQVLRVVNKPEYAERSYLLVLLMAAAAFGYFGQFVGTAITAARAFNPQIPLFLLVAATLTLTSYLLIPIAGLRGAILSIMVANLVQLVGSAGVLFLTLRRTRSVWERS